MKKALGIIALSLLLVIGTCLTSKDAKSSRATAPPPAAKSIASVQEKTGEYITGIGVPTANFFAVNSTQYSGDQFGTTNVNDAIVYISPNPAIVIGVLQFGTSNDYAHVTGPPAGRIYDA